MRFISRRIVDWSFFLYFSMPPVVSRCSSSIKRAKRSRTVAKLVSVPPIQRSVTGGMLHFFASASTTGRICFFVPRNMICEPVAAKCRKKCVARYSPRIVSSRLITWILCRLP